MALIDKVPSEGEQSEELTKIMKEMTSGFEKENELFVSLDINQKKWQNFKIAAINEFSDALDSPVSFFKNEPLVYRDKTVWGSGKKGVAVYADFIVVNKDLAGAESRIYAFDEVNSIEFNNEKGDLVIEGRSISNRGEERNVK